MLPLDGCPYLLELEANDHWLNTDNNSVERIASLSLAAIRMFQGKPRLDHFVLVTGNVPSASFPKVHEVMHSSVDPSVGMSNSARYDACRLPVFRFGSVLPPDSQPFLSQVQLSNSHLFPVSNVFMRIPQPRVKQPCATEFLLCAKSESLWMFLNKCTSVHRSVTHLTLLYDGTCRSQVSSFTHSDTQATCTCAVGLLLETSWYMLPSAVADSKMLRA